MITVLNLLKKKHTQKKWPQKACCTVQCSANPLGPLSSPVKCHRAVIKKNT